MTLIGTIDNAYSTISAVGNLAFNAASLKNVSSSLTQTTVKQGTDNQYYYEHYCPGPSLFGHCLAGTKTNTKEDLIGYNKTTHSTINLATATFTAQGNITGKAGSVSNIGKVSDVQTGKISTNNNKNAHRDAFFSDNFLQKLLSNALFKASQTPHTGYLLETNPLLTHYKSFISSDYLLKKLTSDAVGRDGKMGIRLGDGFLEQKLVREQILSYTGYQTLPHNLSMQDTYTALMNNALDEYQSLKLSTGVELTETQIAELKKPIVWMISQTMQTASGPQQVLVPKVYFSSLSDMVLRPDGALIAANNINLDVKNGITNSGSLLATADLTLKSTSINNTGTLNAGHNTSLTASGDITNSGTVKAKGLLLVKAGGNITSNTQTTVLHHRQNNVNGTETLVGKTASLQAGRVSLSAGNDITLKGSNLTSADKIFIKAGHNFTLASLAINNANRAGNYYSHSTTAHKVSALTGNHITLDTGNTFTSEGAQINARGNLTVAANNINLLTVTDTHDDHSFIGDGDNSIETRSHHENLTGSGLNAGGLLNVVSKQDIYSQGSQLNGKNGINLAASGDITLASAVANNSDFTKTKNHSSGLFGSTDSATTTTSSNTRHHGTHLTSNGNIHLSSGSNILLSDSTAKAGESGNITLHAKDNIQLLSTVDQTTHRNKGSASGLIQQSAHDQGSINQVAVGSGLTGGGNISLDSGNNIHLQGATLAAGKTLSMGTSAAGLQAVTKNANGNYINAAGKQVGNITVGTQVLHNSTWNQSSSGYTGLFKSVMKGLTVVASSVGIKGKIKMGEANATRTDVFKQKTSTLSAKNLSLIAKNNLALIGTNLNVSNTTDLQANNITIDAAKEQTITSHSHTDQTFSATGPTLKKDEINLQTLTDTDQTERTTATSTTWAGSRLNVGNLKIHAKNNLAIIASDVNVKHNSDVKAKNTRLGGRANTTTTTHDSITKTKSLHMGIRNAYLDTALAVQNLKKAKQAVDNAKQAYDNAKLKIAQGKMSREDLHYYKHRLASARKSEKYAGIAVASAVATTAMSTATSGFTANAGLSTQTTRTRTSATQTHWQGSHFNVGGNTNLISQNNLTVKGSTVNTADQLTLNAKHISVLAGKNTTTETSESHSHGTNVSLGYGGGTSGSMGGNESQSHSHSQSVHYVNSSLNAGSLISDSDNLTVKGGTLYGDKLAVKTKKLDVISLQDTAKSDSKSSGRGLSLGIGSAKSRSISGNYNQSNIHSDYASINQQSVISAGDKGYQIHVTGNTNFVGGLISVISENRSNGIFFTIM